MEIELSGGYKTQVSDPKLNKWKWSAKHSCGRTYAVRGYSDNGKMKWILMHTQIMNPPVGMKVRHKDGNTLNNRRKNLEICSMLDVAAHRVYTPVHKYVGVRPNRSGHFVASLGHEYLGVFVNEDDAARAVNLSIFKKRGKNGRLNAVAPLFPNKADTKVTMHIAALWRQRKILSKTGYRGVTQMGENRFVSQISGKPKYLGSFSDPREAAERYDLEAKKRFGALANLNFPLTLA